MVSIVLADRIRGRSAHHFTDPIHDLSHSIATLLDDTGGGCQKPLSLQLGQVLRGHHDNRDGPASFGRPEAVKELEAVHDRHHEIQQDQVWSLFGGDLKGLRSVLRLDDFMANGAQGPHGPLPNVWLVIYHEDPPPGRADM